VGGIGCWGDRLGHGHPLQAVVKGDAGAKLPVAQLESMLRNFVYLNYIRQLLLVAAFGMALHAFGLAYRAGNRA
jgi:hypothetical protein